MMGCSVDTMEWLLVALRSVPAMWLTQGSNLQLGVKQLLTPPLVARATTHPFDLKRCKRLQWRRQ